MSNPNHESGFLRGIIGLGSLTGAMIGFFLLFYIEIPARNENALLLALGLVFGWAGSVVASEFGATTTGRRVAESAIRKIERQDIADEGPAGTLEDPMIVAGSENAEPVPVKETKK